VARVAALVPDLLFGSKVQAALQAAGHDVSLLGAEPPDWSALGALAAGFDQVVPRSRMAREGAGLVTRLAEGGSPKEAL
jgi:hypothetical protein